MRRIVLIVCSILVALICSYSHALSTEVTIFGPKQYLRTSGAPDSYSDSFSGVIGEGRIIIKNGNYDGGRRVEDGVSSATVSVNGVELFGPSDFNPTVYILESAIDILEDNTLSIVLASSPDSYITVEIMGQSITPTASLMANPANIVVGESTSLVWETTYADSVVIEPDIGSVGTNGSITILPTQTTTYTITATGAGGTAMESVTVDVSPIRLQITSPVDAGNLAAPYVLVTGTVSDEDADEIGITVNGVVALVYEDQFAANHVPLDQGENTLTVTATDSLGNSFSKSIKVTADTSVDHVWVRANSETGIAPFETELEIDGSFTLISPNLSHSGETVQYGDPLDNRYPVQITVEGLYFFTVEATDKNDNTYSDVIAVQVYNKDVLDTLLQNRWTSLTDALSAGDKEQSLFYMHSQNQPAYESVFENMIPDMQNFMYTFNGITLLSMHGNEVKYKISTIENGTRYKYPLYFIKDDAGLWKIYSF